MIGFNLSDWALRHKSIVVYLMLVAALAGLWAWGRLGREEDPAFTIKTMVVKTTWPGATTSEMLQQVTDRIEKKLEELPNLDFVRSYTKPGESVVFVNLKDTVSGDATRPLWYQVRKKIDDIRHTLPSGVNGPYFNDEFGDTYALIFALAGEGPSQRELRDKADLMRAELLRSRALGISSQQLANNINAVLSGTRVTQLRESTYLIDIIARTVPEERAEIDTLRNLMLGASGGRHVPLSQIATLSYELEQPLIWRRQRLPTVTVQAEVRPGIEATTVAQNLDGAVETFRSTLPPGYRVVLGGVIEDSAKAKGSIFAVFPLMLLLMMTILMVQLKSFQRLFLVLLTAPLALIGVAASMLLAQAPMGFVAILGVISLIGMVIRNSVILIAQIDQHIEEGEHPWSAVISATEHRLRSILLTAAAAILGMIPIAPTVFWGPMAYAVMGGLIVATLLTLVFLPALYVAWFRIMPEAPSQAGEQSGEASANVSLAAA